MPLKTNLSGGDWWHAHERDYPNSRVIADLEPDFASRVASFVGALTSAGAHVQISSTLRHPSRAYLMHFAWRIAHGTIEPGRVPARAGVPIDWDHGDDRASRAAAQEMVQRARMAHLASLTSHHTRGKAIDMTITWKGHLVLKLPGGRIWEIAEPPTNGAGNRELHEVGSGIFGVRKLLKDPPHWSADGR